LSATKARKGRGTVRSDPWINYSGVFRRAFSVRRRSVSRHHKGEGCNLPKLDCPRYLGDGIARARQLTQTGGQLSRKGHGDDQYRAALAASGICGALRAVGRDDGAPANGDGNEARRGTLPSCGEIGTDRSAARSCTPMAKLTCRFIAGDPSQALRLGDAIYCGEPVARAGAPWYEQRW
jgi:hypothetical protein